MQPVNDAQIVVFRVWMGPEGGDVIALFPDVAHDRAGLYCVCYEHIGQHGAAQYNHVMAQTRPATEAEYAPLKRELEAKPFGYNLDVRKRYVRRRA